MNLAGAGSRLTLSERVTQWMRRAGSDVTYIAPDRDHISLNNSAAGGGNAILIRCAGKVRWYNFLSPLQHMVPLLL